MRSKPSRRPRDYCRKTARVDETARAADRARAVQGVTDGERLIVGRRRRDSRGRRLPATRFAQQQQQGYGSERDQHYQLEIIDIGDHCGLPRHLSVE